MAKQRIVELRHTNYAFPLRRSHRRSGYASKIFSPFRGKRKVTVFGSARMKPDAAEYQQAVAFGKAIVARGYMVITGGGEGIMGAAQAATTASA